MADTDPALLHGTVELLILRTLDARGPLHGLAVSRVLRAGSEGVVELKDAALYQALHRMEARGLVGSRWGHAESGKRAKFYELTVEGRQRLERDARAWRRFTRAVEEILGPVGRPAREGRGG
jgi:transcriptional regulator